MGFGGISLWQLLIVLVIIVLIFGTKKLRNAGGDLGAAVGNFKKSMKDGQDEAEAAKNKPEAIESSSSDAQFTNRDEPGSVSATTSGGAAREEAAKAGDDRPS